MKNPNIHPTAIIDPSAQLAADVTVGAYSIIGAEVTIGSGTVVDHHVEIHSGTVMGARNKIGSFSSLGGVPQHKTYQGEPTHLVIGDDNEIREHVVIHRGSQVDGWGTTKIGNNCYIMAQTHIGHDCQLADNVTLTTGAALAGHCQVAEGVLLGGKCGLHQFVRVGRWAMVGGQSTVAHDVPPFCIAVGNRAKLEGLNLVGLKRRNIPRETRVMLQAAFDELFREDGEVFADRLDQVASDYGEVSEVQELIDFARGTKRKLTQGA